MAGQTQRDREKRQRVDRATEIGERERHTDKQTDMDWTRAEPHRDYM